MNAMNTGKTKTNRNAMTLADYSGASTSRREYERQRKKALMDDPGSWTWSSYAQWKKAQ